VLAFSIMRNIFLSAALFSCLTAGAVAAPDNCCGNIPPIRSIDRTCLPAGAPQADLPMYNTDLAEQYQEIATVDSYISTDKCADTTRNQLRDLQAKGQGIGADAMIRVRMLANQVRGWKENPETPFFSVKQGESQDYFFRATAIKYLRPPQGEPKLAAAPAPRPAITTVSPLIDTNDLLKLNNNRTQRHEMTVPEVMTTNQPQGAP
jgi:hypothetical protein